MKHKLAVIGLGNTLRRDDGIGVSVLESLLKHFKRPDADYFNFGIVSFDLLHKIENYSAVVLIDAIDASLAPAELKIFRLEEIDYSIKNYSSSTHGFNLKSLFELCQTLELKTKIYISGIQVKDVSYGEGLSEELKNKQGEITKEINSFISKVCNNAL